MVYPESVSFPEEEYSTYSAAAVVLAADSLMGITKPLSFSQIMNSCRALDFQDLYFFKTSNAVSACTFIFVSLFMTSRIVLSAPITYVILLFPNGPIRLAPRIDATV